MTNRQIVLDRLPQGDRLAPEHFAARVADRPVPGDGEVLLKTRYISLDAANRAWMQGATYRSALASGQVMAGGGLSEVVVSHVPHLKPGDLVFADAGWQEYAVLPGQKLSKLPDLKPETSESLSYGVVLQSEFIPPEFGRLTLTLDVWKIRQKGIIGLFGEGNAVILDYVLRQQGSSNPLVHRLAERRRHPRAVARPRHPGGHPGPGRLGRGRRHRHRVTIHVEHFEPCRRQNRSNAAI